jgi:hypothetical protein
MKEMGGRNHKQLQDNLKEERKYWAAKEKALGALSEALPWEVAVDRRKIEYAVNLYR